MTEQIMNDDHNLTTPGLLTQNEIAWIDFIRLIAIDHDPPPTLASVQALRMAIGHL